MKLDQIYVYGEDHIFHKGSIEIKDGEIIEVKYIPQGVCDGEDSAPKRYAIPGLVDIHFHGCMGVDLCDALPYGIERMAEYEASVGVTSICPASMTMPVEELHQIMTMVGNYKDSDQESGKKADGESSAEKARAHLVGINMEGPFISRKKKGAQAESAIIPCDVKLFRDLQEDANGRIMVELSII